MKLAITRRDFVTGLAALSAGTLNPRALPRLRNPSPDARIDSEKPPEQYFETWTAQKTGITWKHDNAFSPLRYLPESTGPGGAIFDYNNDGWMDILLVDSGTSAFYKPDAPLHPVLYRNDGNGKFTDVSKEAGLSADLYGQGVAVADYDGDGYEDVFISGYGKCVLYHNN